MFLRIVAFGALVLAPSVARAQDVALNGRGGMPAIAPITDTSSAWLDLRQTSAAKARRQTAPAWVKSIRLVPVAGKGGTTPETIFRIKLRPPGNCRLLLFRLFFDDKPQQRPRVLASDNSGAPLVQTAALGAGLDLPTSETIMIPMESDSMIEVEVPGDGTTIRAAYLDWMASGEVVRPVNGEQRYLMPEAFGATSPLRAPAEDTEKFGTINATLAPETIRIGPTVPQGAAFQFGIESQPLMAMLHCEVSAVRADAPPEVYVNGENIGPVALTLPDLADPAYRGEAERLVTPMHFRYTGWLRAQKLIPVANLKVGTNDIIVIGGAGTPASAIRTTQIQLKYQWEKFDYVLETGP